MILITGASSGFGAACATAFAKEKKNLLLVARRADRLKKMQEALQQQYGVVVHVATLDVSNRMAVQSFAQTHKDILAQVEILVNNAGLAKGRDSIQEGKLDDWDEMIDVNIKGLLYVTHAVLPEMLKKNRGHIINLGSVAGYWAYPKGNVYSATKFAVRGLSESMRLDLSGTDIRVTEIVPGMAETEFSEVRFGDKDKAKAIYQGMKALSAADIAECITWCANRPAHVNIQELVVYPTCQASTSVVHRK